MAKHLHIVTHEIPWPVDYGGVVDLFYKIKALHSLGIKLHLHCFTKRADRPIVLSKYCESIHYYPRNTGLTAISLKLPYIVKSRTDAQLLANLQMDDYPVLLEGVHCTYLFYTGQLRHRKVFIRLHNVETLYYRHLAKHETNIIRKMFFVRESTLLRNYEKRLAQSGHFWAVSTSDEKFYKHKFNASHINFLPVFIPWTEVEIVEGKGTYCLYHGNLSVNENEKAATWLISEVFERLDVQLIIAGKDPSAKLSALANKHDNVSLLANPSEPEMQRLISNAQVNVVPSFNETGVKLKLLNALYNGRFCLANNAAIEGSGLENCCTIANTAAEFGDAVMKLSKEDFSQAIIAQRASVLKQVYDWEKNTRKIIAWIY